MILRSPTEHENAQLRHAGMDGPHQACKDASEDIHVGLIPRLHAGMTQSRDSTETNRSPSSRVFFKREDCGAGFKPAPLFKRSPGPGRECAGQRPRRV